MSEILIDGFEFPEDIELVNEEDVEKAEPYENVRYDPVASKKADIAREEHEKKINNFIFDENQIIENRIFPITKINENTLAFGFFLPKNKDQYDKDNHYLGTTQVRVPVLITSSKNIYERIMEVGENLKLLKVQIPNIPTGEDYPKRIDLGTIKKYVSGEEELIDGKELFESIKREYEKYIYFPEKEWYVIHALWDIGTYFFILFKYYPIMELRGLKGSGKTKIMTISRQISFNASDELTNPSESALFRDTEEKRGAKYLDEAEKLFSINKGKIEGDSRAELINSSYKWTGSVPRVEKIGNKFITRIYHTYSPTMVCSINGLYGATENRAIVHVMVKNPEGDNRGNTELSEEDRIYKKIRNDLYVFTLQNWKSIEETYNKYENNKLKNRDFWILKPLLILAKYVDLELHDRLLDFFIKLSEIKKIDYIAEGSSEFKILNALKQLIGKRTILIKEVADLLPVEEHSLSKRTIARIIDNIGFRDHKVHNRDGNGYEIPQELFFSILSTICPQLIELSSPSSQYSHTEGESIKVSEESVNIRELKLIEKPFCEDGDSREDTFLMKGP